MKSQLVFVGASLLLVACECTEIPLKLPSKAKNLTAMNSAYDDWNCADPTVYFEPGMHFLFSSNRQSQGKDFDIQNLALQLQDDESIAFHYDSHIWGQLVRSINTSQDELGPTVLRESEGTTESYGEFSDIRALAFARGDSGAHDIFVQYVESDSTVPFWEYDSNYDEQLRSDLVVRSMDALNSSADDGYPTYHAESHSILFHSNREGVYRIYQALLPSGVSLQAWIRNPTSVEIQPLTSIQGSDGEERTPFLRSNVLYFVSTRSGGLGGFDIWKSTWNNGIWSTPQNLGDKINSIANEYRPMALRVSGTSNFPKILFWSSDREGGLGGYDLYYAGIR